MPPLWPSNKVLKPSFRSIFSQTKNGRSASFTYFSQASMLLDMCRVVGYHYLDMTSFFVVYLEASLSRGVSS